MNQWQELWVLYLGLRIRVTIQFVLRFSDIVLYHYINIKQRPKSRYRGVGAHQRQRKREEEKEKVVKRKRKIILELQ